MDKAGAAKLFEATIKGDQEQATLRTRARGMKDASEKLKAVGLIKPEPSELSSKELSQADIKSISNIDRVNTHIKAASDLLDTGVDEIEAALKQFNAARAESDSNFKAKLKEIGDSGLDASAYRGLQDRLRLLEEKQEQLEKLEHELAEQRESRKQLLSELRDQTYQQFSTVEANAKKASRADGLKGVVKVKVEKGIDFEGFRAVIAGFDSTAASPTIRKLRESDDVTSFAFAKAILEGSSSLQKQYGITRVTAEKLASAGERLALAIQEITPNPQAVVSLNVGTVDDPHWKRLENLSKGQKATAVLLILLSGASAPLVIDQPEDDLDNRFISTTVVETIRKQKRSRQLIFATHNPNIPVLGDAELVSCLTASVDHGKETSGCKPEHTGSIDVDSVRVMIGELLEGGKEAFDLRKRKYGF